MDRGEKKKKGAKKMNNSTTHLARTEKKEKSNLLFFSRHMNLSKNTHSPIFNGKNITLDDGGFV
jgi:hypothetical protein